MGMLCTPQASAVLPSCAPGQGLPYVILRSWPHRISTPGKLDGHVKKGRELVALNTFAPQRLCLEATRVSPARSSLALASLPATDCLKAAPEEQEDQLPSTGPQPPHRGTRTR